MTKPISGFFKEYRFLSNFWPAKVYRNENELVYNSVEHAYQAAKATTYKDREWIALATRPGLAKKRGRTIVIRSNWEACKLQVMEFFVRQKFTKHTDLKKLLLETGDAELIEANTWGDTFWGRCNGIGENHLGKILMKVREELKCN